MQKNTEHITLLALLHIVKVSLVAIALSSVDFELGHSRLIHSYLLSNDDVPSRLIALALDLELELELELGLAQP